ncbi:efflux RND transporter periplasmic adaptor subunit [Roseovarius sp. S1116L3]|uniref:efflux RND transporter periplasmic adaptor subunit n=1 Tax=Roseovarius roseus TaxID=3342636 RepID=UPI003727B86B
MKTLRQAVLTFAALAAGLYVWIAYVPAAQPLLNRIGLLELLGIETLQAPEAGPQSASSPEGAVRVVTEQVEERALADDITAIGNGRARRSVSVRANAEGTITNLLLEAGQHVESGSVIARLQDQAEQIALERAQIELQNSLADAERIRQLATTGAVTEVRLLETELALRSAELAVRQAEFDLSERQIKAPISGWVGILDVEIGDRVSEQDILVTITDRSDILIDFRVPERVVGKIEIGQPIDVIPLGSPNRVLIGEVAAIDAVVDRASRTLLVQGRVSNEQDLLRDGMAFSVNLSFAGDTLLSVAPLALRWSSAGPYVWAVHDGKATEVPVAIVQRNTDAVLVTSDDLRTGETIVTEGVQTLREGAEVIPLAQAEEAASAGLSTKQAAQL